MSAITAEVLFFYKIFSKAFGTGSNNNVGSGKCLLSRQSIIVMLISVMSWMRDEQGQGDLVAPKKKVKRLVSFEVIRSIFINWTWTQKFCIIVIWGELKKGLV